ncbi:MAG: hypothetical protein JJU05_19230 [Verrucomicrobia bacterium]|nr:hypothetical protein [Verrucomicrobiota bacterium]
MLGNISKELRNLLCILSDMRKERRDLADNALRAVSHALNETHLYYRDFGTIGSDSERERQLALLWSAAAIPVRHIDEGFALTCDQKAEYWTNPTNFSDDDIEKFGIELGKVKRKYRKILAPNKDFDD